MMVVTAVIIAFVVQIARGHDPGAVLVAGALGALGGVSDLVALVTLRLRG